MPCRWMSTEIGGSGSVVSELHAMSLADHIRAFRASGTCRYRRARAGLRQALGLDDWSEARRNHESPGAVHRDTEPEADQKGTDDARGRGREPRDCSEPDQSVGDRVSNEPAHP